MKRPLAAFFLIGALVIIVAGALTIPFVFESQTLWYKIGMDKTLLLGGQLVGIIAFISLSVQILLGIRGKVLAETFTVATVVAWHKTNGILLCCLAALHIILVLVPEGIANLPIGVKYWPEMVGGALFLMLIFQAIFSVFRQQLGFMYKRWRMGHRVLGYLALCLASVHVLFVADSFVGGTPRRALLVLIAAVLVSIFFVKVSPHLNKIREKR